MRSPSSIWPVWLTSNHRRWDLEQVCGHERVSICWLEFRRFIWNIFYINCPAANSKQGGWIGWMLNWPFGKIYQGFFYLHSLALLHFTRWTETCNTMFHPRFTSMSDSDLFTLWSLQTITNAVFLIIVPLSSIYSVFFSLDETYWHLLF